MAWAYICDGCDHPMTQHRLRKSGDLREGPYDCRAADCDCAIPQSAPCYELGKAEFDRRFPDYDSRTAPDTRESKG